MSQEKISLAVLINNSNIPAHIFSSPIDKYFGPQIEDFKASSLEICILSGLTGWIPAENNITTYIKSQWLYMTSFFGNDVFEFKVVICDNRNWNIIAQEDIGTRYIKTSYIDCDKVFLIRLNWNETLTSSIESLTDLYSMDESFIKSHYECQDIFDCDSIHQTCMEPIQNLDTINEDVDDNESLNDSLQQESNEDEKDNISDCGSSIKEKIFKLENDSLGNSQISLNKINETDDLDSNPTLADIKSNNSNENRIENEDGKESIHDSFNDSNEGNYQDIQNIEDERKDPNVIYTEHGNDNDSQFIDTFINVKNNECLNNYNEGDNVNETLSENTPITEKFDYGFNNDLSLNTASFVYNKDSNDCLIIKSASSDCEIFKLTDETVKEVDNSELFLEDVEKISVDNTVGKKSANINVNINYPNEQINQDKTVNEIDYNELFSEIVDKVSADEASVDFPNEQIIQDDTIGTIIRNTTSDSSLNEALDKSIICKDDTNSTDYRLPECNEGLLKKIDTDNVVGSNSDNQLLCDSIQNNSYKCEELNRKDAELCVDDRNDTNYYFETGEEHIEFDHNINQTSKPQIDKHHNEITNPKRAERLLKIQSLLGVKSELQTIQKTNIERMDKMRSELLTENNEIDDNKLESDINVYTGSFSSQKEPIQEPFAVLEDDEKLCTNEIDVNSFYIQRISPTEDKVTDYEEEICSDNFSKEIQMSETKFTNRMNNEYDYSNKGTLNLKVGIISDDYFSNEVLGEIEEDVKICAQLTENNQENSKNIGLLHKNEAHFEDLTSLPSNNTNTEIDVKITDLEIEKDVIEENLSEDTFKNIYLNDKQKNDGSNKHELINALFEIDLTKNDYIDCNNKDIEYENAETVQPKVEDVVEMFEKLVVREEERPQCLKRIKIENESFNKLKQKFEVDNNDYINEHSLTCCIKDIELEKMNSCSEVNTKGDIETGNKVLDFEDNVELQEQTFHNNINENKENEIFSGATNIIYANKIDLNKNKSEFDEIIELGGNLSLKNIEKIVKEKRERLAVNDDYKYPDSVTPTKVEHDLSKSPEYNVPFMDDEAFYSESWYEESDDRWTSLDKPNTSDQDSMLKSPGSELNASFTPKPLAEAFRETDDTKPQIVDEAIKKESKRKGLISLCGCVGGR